MLITLSDLDHCYFDDIFVHSLDERNLSDVQAHLQHFETGVRVTRDNNLYANLKKCVFCAPEILVLGFCVIKLGFQANSERSSLACSWPTPKNPTELRQ